MSVRAAPLLVLLLATMASACGGGEDSRPPLSIALEPIDDVGCPLRLAAEGLDGGVLDVAVLEVPRDGPEGHSYVRVAVAPDRRFAVRISADNTAGFYNLPQAHITLLGPTSDTGAEQTVTLVGTGESPMHVEARLVLQSTAREVTLRVRALAREEIRVLRLEPAPASLTLEPRGIDALDGGIPEAGIGAGSGDAALPEGGVPPPSMSVVRYVATLRCLDSGAEGINGQTVTFSGVPGVEPNPAMATTNALGEASTWVLAPQPRNSRLIARAGTLEDTFPDAPTPPVEEMESP